MYGDNPIRPPLQGDGNTLDIQHIFPTLQGEGPFTGRPSVFVRLGGCNLACSFCDTEFESFQPMQLADILEKVETLATNVKGERVRQLVVLTGGEPLRQPIEKLCQELLWRGFQVQVETNGMLYRQLPEEVHIVCSPKNTGQGYFPIRPDMLARINAFKFIVSAQDAFYGDVAEIGQSQRQIPVYVQPMDEGDDVKNARNVALAAELAQQRGYRLSLQVHKILGIE